MTIVWKGNKIVELERSFLDTNGVRKKATAKVVDLESANPFGSKEFSKENFIDLMKDLNHASQKGLNELYDDSIGRGAVLKPFGARRQTSPADGSVKKLP